MCVLYISMGFGWVMYGGEKALLCLEDTGLPMVYDIPKINAFWV